MRSVWGSADYGVQQMLGGRSMMMLCITFIMQQLITEGAFSAVTKSCMKLGTLSGTDLNEASVLLCPITG